MCPLYYGATFDPFYDAPDCEHDFIRYSGGSYDYLECRKCEQIQHPELEKVNNDEEDDCN
jgi:hypothetical protein